MTDVRIHRGDQVLCENGHLIATLNRDLHRGDLNYSTAFDFVVGQHATKGDPLPLPCATCGGTWFDNGHAPYVQRSGMTDDVKYAAVQCMALIDMHRLRNGKASVENVYADKLQSVIEEFFGVKRANVNDVMLTDETFSKFFGI